MGQRIRLTALWAVSVALLCLVCGRARQQVIYGLDFRAVFDGALNLRLHLDPYLPVPDRFAFVYPPFAALVFLPISFLRADAAVAAGLLLGAVSFFLIAVSCARLIGRALLGSCAAVVLVVLSISRLGLISLALTNLSILMAAGISVALALAAANRWRSAAIVLGTTIAIKPVVLLALLIFLSRRKWQAGALCAAIPAGLNLAVLPFLASPARFFTETLSSLAAGSTLPLRYNVSIGAALERAGGSAALQHLARVAVVLVATAVVAAVWRLRGPLALTILAVTPVLGFVLASRTDELHYTLSAVPLAVALIAMATGWARALAVTATVLSVALPVGATTTQLLLLIAAGLAAKQCRDAVGERTPLEVVPGSTLASIGSAAPLGSVAAGPAPTGR